MGFREEMQVGMKSTRNRRKTDHTTLEHWHQEEVEEENEEKCRTEQAEEYGKAWGASQEEELRTGNMESQ